MKNEKLSKENRKKIFIQINKEATITLILYLIFFIWWYYFAYIYSSNNIAEYKFIFGLPEWFFYSCIVGLVMINLLVFIAVKFFFKEIDFEEFENLETSNRNNNMEEK